MPDLATLKRELANAAGRLTTAEEALRTAERQGNIAARKSAFNNVNTIEQEINAIKNEINSVGKGVKLKHGVSKVFSGVGEWWKKRKSKSPNPGNPTPRPSPVSSPAPSSGKFYSTGVGPFFVFIMALANYIFHWYAGFQINIATLAVDAFTLFVFIFAAYGFWLSFLPFSLQTIIPGLLITIPGLASLALVFSNTISVMLIMPWWLILAFMYELKRHPDAPAVKWMTIIGIALALFFFSPSFLNAVSTTDYVINQKLIHDIKDTISEKTTETIKSSTDQYKIYKCTLSGTATSECRKEVLGTEEELAKRLKIDDSLTTGFNVEISEFVKEGHVLIGNKIPSYISAVNNMEEPAALVFSCGFEGREPGTPDKETIEIGKGILPMTQKSVMCTLDTTRKGTPEFYFDVSAKDVSAESYKEIIVIGKNAREAVLSKYQGISENRILELSKEFGPYIRERRQYLNPRVGKDDLVQPIIQDGVITAFGAESPLLYGIEQGTEIDFALFLKNNGDGYITKIRDIKFDTPPGYKLVPEDCGFNKDLLEGVNLKKIARGNIELITSCKLVVQGAKINPNNPESKIISVKVDYDYTILKKRKVSIA